MTERGAEPSPSGRDEAAQEQPPVVTIDGTSGAGKGTLAHRLAGWLGFHLLDSGALYRLLALSAERCGIALDDAPALVRLAAGASITFEPGDASDPVRPMLDGEDVTAAIRAEGCGQRASLVAALPAVRDALLARQHAFRAAPGLVADGRDMGTIVFPDARLKIFLTASVEARAERRHKQLMGKGISASLPTLDREIAKRDRRDQERTVAPLRPADDAVEIDSTSLTVDALLEHVKHIVCERGILPASRIGMQAGDACVRADPGNTRASAGRNSG